MESRCRSATPCKLRHCDTNISIVCAGIVSLATITTATNGAVAAAKVVSHSNTNNNRLDPNDPNAAKKCTDGGGTVITDDQDRKSCKMAVKGSGIPKNSSATVTTPKGKSLDQASPN